MDRGMSLARGVIAYKEDSTESCNSNNCQCQENGHDEQNDTTSIFLWWRSELWRYSIALPGIKYLGWWVNSACIVSVLVRLCLNWRTERSSLCRAP